MADPTDADIEKVLLMIPLKQVDIINPGQR